MPQGHLAGTLTARKGLMASTLAVLEDLMGCRDVMWEEDEDGRPRMSGIRMTTAGRERIVKADAYVAALDVPGVKKLLPQVPSHTFQLARAGFSA